jgi:hypothetical protein
MGSVPISSRFIASFLSSYFLPSSFEDSSSIFSTFRESLFCKPPPLRSPIIELRGALRLRVGVLSSTEAFMLFAGISRGVLLKILDGDEEIPLVDLLDVDHLLRDEVRKL